MRKTRLLSVILAAGALVAVRHPWEQVRAQEVPAPYQAGPGGGLSPYATLPPAPKRANPLDRITPVTDRKLVHPSDGEWLLWVFELPERAAKP